MKLTFIHHFDAAHRLEFHEGVCHNLHGHRWQVIVEIDSYSTDDMIVDFGELKEIINEFDHTTILKYCNENEKLKSTLVEMHSKVILLVNSPTAENLSKEIHDRILRRFTKDIIAKLKVIVYESPNASIEYQ